MIDIVYKIENWVSRNLQHIPLQLSHEKEKKNQILYSSFMELHHKL